MFIPTLIIYICCGLIILSIISCMMNPLFRLPRQEDDADENDGNEKLSSPPLSVIVLVNDNADTLERNLPLFLKQNYASGYQVIVVANEGDAFTSDLMERYKDVACLQSTFIPNTSRYISREKLGVTLGVKAANKEWCLLTDALCYPKSDNWLAEMGKACTDDKNLVVGYSNFAHESKVFQRFSRLRHFARLYRESVSMLPFAANYSNLAFRKSEFIAGDGYRGNLHCVRGEYDFIVNKYAKKDGTAIVTSLDGMLTETPPTKKQWRLRRVFYIHSCKLMDHGFLHNSIAILDSILLHTAWLSNILAIALAIYVQNWVILAAAIVALLILIIWRTIIGMKTSKRFDAKIPAWAVFILELTSIWHTLFDHLRYSKASKYDFTCHKL